MNRMPYEVDFINEKIILTKKFYKAASILNSPEYKTMLQLRTENPGFEIVLKEIKKKEGKKSYRNLTYANMREYIVTREGEKSETVAEFDRILALSKVQAGPYSYVKTWFLNNYANYSEQPEFDADGFVIVKTKSEMEAEAAAKEAETEAEAQVAEAGEQVKENAA